MMGPSLGPSLGPPWAHGPNVDGHVGIGKLDLAASGVVFSICVDARLSMVEYESKSPAACIYVLPKLLLNA
jgi:hypothetical protein